MGQEHVREREILKDDCVTFGLSNWENRGAIHWVGKTWEECRWVKLLWLLFPPILIGSFENQVHISSKMLDKQAWSSGERCGLEAWIGSYQVLLKARRLERAYMRWERWDDWPWGNYNNLRTGGEAPREGAARERRGTPGERGCGSHDKKAC